MLAIVLVTVHERCFGRKVTVGASDTWITVILISNLFHLRQHLKERIEVH